MTITRFPARRNLVLLTSLAFLGGCTSFSPDGGLDRVASITQERMGVTPIPLRSAEDTARVADEMKRLLAEPLSVDNAVKITILNNRGLQASLAELGIAEAELVQAGRLRNPAFTFRRVEGGGISDFERQFLFDLMGLITLPTRSGIEQRRFEVTQIRVASDVLRLAQQTRQAWFSAVAAQEAAKYMEAVQDAAAAGAELATRMAEQGNFSRLRQQREQLFHAEISADVVRARQLAVTERERLTRLLGLAGSLRTFRLPERLPDLPDKPLDEGSVMRQAMDNRLDVRMARREIDGLAKSLGLTRASRFVNVLDVSYLNNNTSGEPHLRGYEIELSLPIFDWGEASVARAEALYTQAMHRVAEIAVDAESEVAEAYAAYRATHDLARRYRDQIVPLTKQIAEENLLRYNGMLIGVWDLLADTRGQIVSVNAAIQAQKDFWIAESNLQISLNSGGASSMTMSTQRSTAAETAAGH